MNQDTPFGTPSRDGCGLVKRPHPNLPPARGKGLLVIIRLSSQLIMTHQLVVAGPAHENTAAPLGYGAVGYCWVYFARDELATASDSLELPAFNHDIATE